MLMNMVEAIRDALELAMAADPRVVVVGLDVARMDGALRATDGLLERFGSRRVVDIPISEGAILGASLGLAASGLVPVAEIQLPRFASEGAHQIGPQLARYRDRCGRCPMPVTIRAPFRAGPGGVEPPYDAVEAQLVQLPGLKVVAPSNPHDAKGMLLEAIRDPDPVLFCEPAGLYTTDREEVPEGAYTVPLGAARVHRRGEDVTLVAWSAGVELCDRAACELATRGIDAGVLDLRSLVPLDVQSMTRAVEETGRCVVVHDVPLTGGFGAEVAATLQEEAFSVLEAPVQRVAARDVPAPGGPAEWRTIADVDRVVEAAERTLCLRR